MPSSGIVKKTIMAVLATAAIALLFSETHAQTAAQPQFMMTWTAHGSYVPPGYAGKALPNQESKITASLALIANGQQLNLKNKTIYWYLNDTLIGGGVGIQNVSFAPFGGAPNFMTLKVELPNYNGNLLLHAIQIPLIQPKAIIETQHVNGKFSVNPLVLIGTPYYFNISDPSALSYQWLVDGQAPATAENPQILQINLNSGTQSGSTFTTSLTITNPTDSMSAADSANLMYVK
jgi:hypothetical protein